MIQNIVLLLLCTSFSGLVYDCIPVEWSSRRGSEFLLLFFCNLLCCFFFGFFCQCWGIISVVLEVWLLSYFPVVACTYMSQEAATRSLEGTALGNKTTWYNNHQNVLINSFKKVSPGIVIINLQQTPMDGQVMTWWCWDNLRLRKWFNRLVRMSAISKQFCFFILTFYEVRFTKKSLACPPWNKVIFFIKPWFKTSYWIVVFKVRWIPGRLIMIWATFSLKWVSQGGPVGPF